MAIKCFVIALLILTGIPSCVSESAEMVDLIIHNGYLVTMNDGRELIENGTIVINDSRILKVGGSELAKRYRSRKVIDAGGDIVMPGMINLHTHLSMTIFRGLADDTANRLERFIFPLEKTAVDAEAVYWGALLGAVEMVQGGVTTLVDMYYFEDKVAEAIKKVGIRGVLGETVIGFPAPDAKEAYGGLAYAERFIREYRGDELVTPALAPHAPHTVDTANFKKILAMSEKYDVPVLIHLAETTREISIVRDKHNKTPVEYMDSLGLLNKRFLAAHCIFVSDSDIELMKARGIGVAHNMVANIKSAKGVSPALDMFNQGLRIGLGTDGPMSGNTLDIIGQMGYVAKVHKLINKDRTVMPPAIVVEMATLGGAKALHREGELGSLEPGKLADIVIVDKDAPNMIPMYDVYSALVYSANASNVRTSIIHGRVVMRDRKILSINMEQLKARINQLCLEIQEIASGL